MIEYPWIAKLRAATPTFADRVARRVVGLTDPVAVRQVLDEETQWLLTEVGLDEASIAGLRLDWAAAVAQAELDRLARED